MADGPLIRPFWRALDAVDYWITQLRLYIADAICGSEPSVPVDQERAFSSVAPQTSHQSETTSGEAQFRGV